MQSILLRCSFAPDNLGISEAYMNIPSALSCQSSKQQVVLIPFQGDGLYSDRISASYLSALIQISETTHSAHSVASEVF